MTQHQGRSIQVREAIVLLRPKRADSSHFVMHKNEPKFRKKRYRNLTFTLNLLDLFHKKQMYDSVIME